MHETIVAQFLLHQISEEAKKQNARPIAAKISCGAIEPVNDETLSFAFEVISEGTICKGMKLTIEHKKLLSQCRQCGRQFEFDMGNPACCACQSFDTQLLHDSPLMLESIEFETEQ